MSGEEMSADELADARAVANSWTTEWLRGSTYEITGDEPEWDTTDIARALYEVLGELDREHARAEAAEAELAKLRADRRASGLRGLLDDSEAENERLRTELAALRAGAYLCPEEPS